MKMMKKNCGVLCHCGSGFGFCGRDGNAGERNG